MYDIIGWAITVLIMLVVIATILQKDQANLSAALIITSLTLFHELFFSAYDGTKYYLSAALFDMAAIILLSRLNPLPKIALDLQIVSFVSILTNTMGWVVWFRYYPPVIYDLAYVVIYSWVLLLLIKRIRLHVGRYTGNSRSSRFQCNSSSRAIHFNKNQG